MEVERGMAHIYGDPDPNANAGQGFRDEPGRVPQSNAGTFGSDNTTGTGPGTGFTRTGEHEDYGRRGEVDKGVGTETSGYGSDDKRSQSGVQNLEQRPATDRNTEMNPGADGRDDLSPNRGTQNAGFEDGRSPMSQAGSLGGTGFTRTGEHDGYERGGGVDSGVGRGTSGYGPGDERAQSGVQNLEQQPAIDRNTEMSPSTGGRGGLSPNRSPQNAGFEEDRSPMSQGGGLSSIQQQKMRQDPPPALPPRPQAQATNDDQSGQMYQ